MQPNTATQARPAYDVYQTLVTDFVIQAYNTGLLQYHPLQVYGITITMTMGRRFNTVYASCFNASRHVNIYTHDSELATEHAIGDLISSMWTH
jgi:hypothetical protein